MFENLIWVLGALDMLEGENLGLNPWKKKFIIHGQEQQFEQTQMDHYTMYLSLVALGPSTWSVEDI